MNLAILLVLFFVFFKIGLFSFGGGYAILPLIQADVVDLYKEGYMVASQSIEKVKKFV